MKNAINIKAKKKIYILIIISFTGMANSHAQWVSVNSPTSVGNSLRFINFTSKNKVWAAGNNGNGNQVIYSNDGGYTYKINTQTGTLTYPIIEVTPISDDTAFFIAQTYMNSKVRYWLLKTVNGGDSIQPYFIVNGIDTAFSKSKGPRIIKFWDHQHGFIMGDTVNGCLEVYNTQDGGQNWIKDSCNNIRITIVPNLSALSEIITTNSVAIVNQVQQNIWFKSKDYGKTWDSLSSNLSPNFLFNNYCFKDSINGISTLRALTFPVSSSNTVAITSDGGKTWDTSYSAPDIVNVITYAKDSIVGKSFYIAGGPNGSYTSFDDGKTWNQLDTYEHDAISFYNSHTGISSHPKQFTGDGILVFSEFTGIDDIKSKTNEIHIYPNPATNNITLSTSVNTIITQLNFTDILGKNYPLNYKKENENFIIDVSKLPTGIYFLQATTNNGVLNKKVLIER